MKIKHRTIMLSLLLPLLTWVARAEEPCPEYNLRVVSTNNEAGIVAIIQQPSCENGNTAIVEAIPNEGYRFDHWTDGNTDNPRTIVLERNWTLLATWEELPCVDLVLTAISTYAIAGKIEVLQEPSCENGNTAIVEAIPNEHFRFTGWTDGNTDNPRTITLTKDTRIFATWEQIPCDTFQLNISSSDNQLGTVTVLQEPRCENDNVAVISATPAEGCDFITWSDGVKQSTRVISLSQDTSLTAIFNTTIYYVVAAANNSDFGNVSGSGTYVYGMEVTLQAFALPGYRFDHWGDGIKENPRTITVTGDADYTAIFEPEYHTVTVLANSNSMGAVSGSGSYQDNSYAVISAKPHRGYTFLSWNDGNTLAERSVLVLRDITYTAYFAPATSLESTLAQEISTEGLTIIFSNCQAKAITVLAVNGQTIYRGKKPDRITMPEHGLYLIVTDNETLRIML